jgi:hypothetical protein
MSSFVNPANPNIQLLVRPYALSWCTYRGTKQSRLRARRSKPDLSDELNDEDDISFARDAAWEASLEDTVLDEELIASSEQALIAKKSSKGLKKLPELILLDSERSKWPKSNENPPQDLDLWAANGVVRSEVRAFDILQYIY